MLKIDFAHRLLIILFSFFAFALTSCSTPSRPTIELRPQISTSSSNIGAGKSVQLTVIDARSKNDSSANIDSSQDVSRIFRNELSNSLRSKGFALSDLPADNHFIFKLRSIDYRSLSGYLSSNVQTFVSADVTIQNRQSTFSKTYNASAYNDNYLSPIKQLPSEQVNSAINKLLNTILNDNAVLQALTSHS